MPTLEEFLSHPVESLERALHLRKQIDELNEVLKELFGPTPVSLAGVQAAVPARQGKRTMSAAGRARVAAAQRARWAKQKATHGPETAIVLERMKERKKSGLSAEGRAKIIAAQKARWAKVKGKKPAASPAKSAPKKKRQLSPEARARIVAAVKARWARERRNKT